MYITKYIKPKFGMMTIDGVYSNMRVEDRLQRLKFHMCDGKNYPFKEGDLVSVDASAVLVRSAPPVISRIARKGVRVILSETILPEIGVSADMDEVGKSPLPREKLVYLLHGQRGVISSDEESDETRLLRRICGILPKASVYRNFEEDFPRRSTELHGWLCAARYRGRGRMRLDDFNYLLNQASRRSRSARREISDMWDRLDCEVAVYGSQIAKAIPDIAALEGLAVDRAELESGVLDFSESFRFESMGIQKTTLELVSNGRIPMLGLNAYNKYRSSDQDAEVVRIAYDNDCRNPNVYILARDKDLRQLVRIRKMMLPEAEEQTESWVA